MFERAMYTTALLCFIILASPLIVQSQQYNFTALTGTLGLTETSSYPGARAGSCLQLKKDGSGLFLFGGLTLNGNTYSVAAPTLWQYTFKNSSWNVLLNSSVASRPPGRESMACWVDSNGLLNIYGGDTSLDVTSASGIMQDQYVANSTAWTTITSDGPDSAPATWRNATTAFIFGGYVAGNGGTTAAIRSFNDAKRTYTRITNGYYNPTYSGSNQNPGTRNRMAFATASGSVGWMFGGAQSSTNIYGDLWSFSLTSLSWTYVSGKTSVNNYTIADNMPPCMLSAVMVITSYGNILLYGGSIPMNGALQGLTYLWRYSINTKSWMRFSGASYFTSGTAPATLIAYTSDLAGGAYLFGGAINSTGNGPLTNTLYHFTFNECPPGSVIVSNGTCSLCPAGTYSANYSDVCTVCAAGTANNQTGLAAQGCPACPAGTSSTTIGATACGQCGLGLGSSPGNPGCNMCNPGYYALNSTCTPCPVGTYFNASGAAQCLPCPPGTYINATGSTSCSTCPAGTYADGGATVCYNCPPGYYRTASDTSPYGCTPVAPGSSATARLSGGGGTGNVTATVAGTQCLAGAYSDSYGAVNCSMCPVGAVAQSQGATTCRLCPPGSQTKNPSSTGNVNCAPCAAARYSRIFGTEFCNYCPYGSIPSSGQTYCAYCPQGTYHDGLNTDGCNKVDSFGNLAPCCSPCPAGTYNSVQGSLSCIPCAQGYYAPNKGSLYCLQCPLNTHSVNGTSCVQCPSGAYSPGGSQWCSPTGY